MSRSCKSKRGSLILILVAVTLVQVTSVHLAPAQALRLVDPMIDALRQLEGHYNWDQSRGVYAFSDRPGLAKLADEAEPERHLPLLVYCLDVDTPAKVSLAGKPVPLGQLCYEVLTLIAYHEPVDSQGDILATWPGHLEPQAEPAARAAAKTAWQAVLQAGSYVLY